MFDITIDYQFLSNCISAQMQMQGRLLDNQFLIVEEIEIDEDGLINLSCSMIEEAIN